MNMMYLEPSEWVALVEERRAERGKWTSIVRILLSALVVRIVRVLVKPQREMRWSPVEVWAGLVTART
jgi:hypothetical protein